MYGLLLDSIQKFLCEKYGEQYWDRIRRRANLQNHWFVTHEVYSDDVLLDLVNAAAIELGEDNGTVMRMFGEYFAKNIGHYGYARLLRVLGRDLRDFLNGLDDLHEYLRFSYPKMCSPSFFCESETEEGMILHYTTKRKGYNQYVIGQLTTVGRIYGKDLEIRVLSEEIAETGARPVHITMELKFDNSALLREEELLPLEKDFSINADTFLGVFPFCILFDKDLTVCRQGNKLKEVLPSLMGKHLGDCFTVRKPMIDDISWKQINLQANSVFELVSMETVDRKMHHYSLTMTQEINDQYLTIAPHLRLKGQMLLIEETEMVAFLCSPVMDSPEELYESGIFVNDLSMHDSSRDMILAGSQKDPELKIALSQEKIRSAQLEESIQQTDRLLFQMIPKPIADQLRNGETPLNTCREFSSVSILFSDIVSFTPMCSRLHPMEVVCVLNAMCVAFDRLCETHHVYKVETIGDAYMVICGAPVCTVYHAEHITAFGLDVIQAARKINDPSTGKSIRVRVGIHSGNIVAGVVGSTVLRYDVFGDTVNVAARMEATGAPMKVHISEATAQLLKGTPFAIETRGSVDIKGKGHMNTYWVTGKPGGPAAVPVPSPPRKSATVLPIVRQPPEDAQRPSEKRLASNTRPSDMRLSTASISSQALSTGGPKPNEWPQANIQLRRFISDAAAMDHSVPPGWQEGLRRNTVPAIPTNYAEEHDKAEGPLSSRSFAMGGTATELRRRSSIAEGPLLNLEQVLPTSTAERLQSRKPLLSPFETQSLVSSLEESYQADSLLYEDDPVPFHDKSSACLLDSTMSEMNLLHVRAFSGNVPRAPLSSLQALEQFAMQADKNAQQAERSASQARSLAKWAHSIMQQVRRNHQPPHKRLASEFEGTPVDPVSDNLAPPPVSTGAGLAPPPISVDTPSLSTGPTSQNDRERCTLM